MLPLFKNKNKMKVISTEKHTIKEWAIYKIISPSFRVYIGITSNIDRRMKDYSNLRCKSQKLLYSSLKKYGFNNHSVNIIDSFIGDSAIAQKREMYWISEYKSNISRHPNVNGLNCVDGGIGSFGYKMSDETKQKIRDANLGKRYSADVKRKLSEIRKGEKINYSMPKERKEFYSRLNSGRKHTEEAKIKIGLASAGNKHNIGRKKSNEFCEMISRVNIGNKHCLGIKHTAEHNKKISEGNKGKIVSEETKIKMRIANSKKEGRHVFQYSKTNELIKEHISIREAARYSGILKSSIIKQLKREAKNPKYFFFKYK